MASPQADDVIKLQIGSHYAVRRFKIKDLFDDSESISYKKLLRIAVRNSPEFKRGKGISLNEWDITTSYHDEEGDWVLFSSNEELVEALQEAKKRSVIFKCRADVTKKLEPPLKQSDGDNNKSRTSVPLKPTLLNGMGNDQTGAARLRQQLPLVIESFVSILAATLFAIHSHLAAAGAATNRSDRDDSVSHSDATSNKDSASEGTDLQEQPDIEKVATHEDVTDQNKEETGKSENEKPSEDNTSICTEDNASGNVTTDAQKEEKKGAPPVPGFDPNFVHLRHTCDGCMKCPIIGIRYHSTNIPDYDLCADCMKKFSGHEINFEPEELERDRRNQHRFARRACKEQREMRHSQRMMFPGCRRWKDGQHNSGDAALEEAIRLSLLELSRGKGATPKANPDQATNPSGTSTPSQKPSANATAQQADLEKTISKVVEAVGFTIDHVAVAVGAVISDFLEVDNTRAKPKEEASDDLMSHSVEKVPEVTVSPSEEGILAAESADSPGCEKKKGIEKEVSGVKENLAAIEDAKGDEIEVEATSTNELSKKGDVDDDTSSDSVLILASTNEDAMSDENKAEVMDGADEWLVVDPSKDGENMARATAAIGSAMFEEGVIVSSPSSSCSGSMVSSLGSSVPTISSNPAVPAAVYAQWASEIQQLRELGFTDDRRSAEALETLQAANLGVDSSDPVTLDAAVNYLLNQQD